MLLPTGTSVTELSPLARQQLIFAHIRATAFA
jgi:hypothetical protein